jgi:DNA-binding SARP family transcriptional activator
MRVDISLLGRFSVAVDGRPIPGQAWSRRSAAALVKLLALRPERRLPRDQVIDLLWPDLLVDRAGPRLHKAAHFARTVLGPGGVVLSADVVALLPQAQVVVDVARFDEAARAHHPGGDPSVAERAIELYAGDLLPDDAYEPWAEAERERLRLCYLALIRATRRWADLVVLEPLDEEAHLHLVHQYLQDGDRGRALRQLDALEQLWRQELGIEPGPAARALRADVQPCRRTTSAARRSPAGPPGCRGPRHRPSDGSATSAASSGCSSGTGWSRCWASAVSARPGWPPRWRTGTPRGRPSARASST